jgi:two-component system, OmpR family, phosphate regulon sensor histidine kinase PhoR
MPSPSVSDVPLYDLAAGAIPQPTVLQLSPMTFKSIVSSIVDLLSELTSETGTETGTEPDSSAIVWAKLPKGEVWQTELERCAQASPGSQVYLFQNPQDSFSFLSSEDTDTPRTAQSAPVVIPTPTALRREYFLVVWSGQMQVTLVAHRLRGGAQAKSPPTSFDSVGGSLDRQDSTEPKQQLLCLCVPDASLTESVVRTIAATIVAPEPQAAIELEAIDLELLPPKLLALENWIDLWQQQIAALPPSPTLHCLGSLLTKQLQKQEENWQRSTVYRKQAESAESLQLQNVELLNTVRMRDEFLNTVGQELRTPLTTIKTALKLLNSPNFKPPQRQRYMDLIDRECDRQSSLITRLLELVQLDQRADQDEVQSLHLSEVVPGVVSTYQPLAEEKGVRLTYAVPDDLPPIACVSNWLKQIVINLLHNGIKFTPTGGQVWVRAKPHGTHVQLEFRDTGIGIAPSEIPKIFDRFYRGRSSGDESASSTGLGLTIVQQLLVYCGGTISVQSKLGEGSCFHVLLPIYQPPNSPIDKA